jgi:hypothetical protein
VRVWRWARNVIADRGEHDPVPISLERTGKGGYAFRLGVRAGFGGQDAARIPTFVRPNPDPHPILKEVHFCEVAGRTLEAANVHALRAKVAAALETIAPARTLPLAYFRAPAMDYSLPVYEHGGEIVSPVLGGPQLKGRDLADIRRRVCRYLVSAGYVAEPEEVIVGVLRPSDLRLVAPAAVFRSLADPDLWLPSVEGSSSEGPVVGVLDHGWQLRAGARPRRGAGPVARDSAPAAPDVLALLRHLRAELRRSRGPGEPEAVYAAEVREDAWASAEERTGDARSRLVAYLADDEATRLELPVRRTGAGDVATALEDRGVNAFLAADEDALAGLVGRYLTAHGFLRFAEEIEIHPADPPRAERLEADDIWTFGERFVEDIGNKETHA